MPTTTYTPLANTTLASAVSSITFSSIPATYRDLIIVLQGGSSASQNVSLRLNADSGANYSCQFLAGNGSAATATSATSQTGAFLTQTAQPTTTSSTQININIMDYSATNKHKTILSRAVNAALGTDAFVNRWANTAAVTSVTIFLSSGTLAIGTTVALYGIVS